MEKIIENNKYEVYRLNISFKDSGHFTNTYILKDKKTEDSLIIDPAYNGKYILECINKIHGSLKAIYLTHCHGDHIAALEEIFCLYKENNLKIYIHENDKPGIFDDDKNCKYILSEPNFSCLKLEDICSVSEKDLLRIGNIQLEVISTPGHTNGSSILYEKEENILFTGDTLFSECFGRTDLKSGNMQDMKQSLNKIFSRFDSNLVIYPGHGEAADIREAKRKIEIITSFN